MTYLQKAITALIRTHGGLRALGRATDIDPSYLKHLRDGTKATPSDAVLAKLGLERSVTYRRKHPQAGEK